MRTTKGVDDAKRHVVAAAVLAAPNRRRVAVANSFGIPVSSVYRWIGQGYGAKQSGAVNGHECIDDAMLRVLSEGLRRRIITGKTNPRRPPCKVGQIWRDRSYDDDMGGRRYLRVLEIHPGQSGLSSSMPFASPHGGVTMERVDENEHGEWVARATLRPTVMKLNASGAPKSSAFVIEEDV